MTTTTVAPVETVRASINERKFFEMQGQLYKSAHSFLGELMQNARRAGSSAVWFHLDKEAAQLICRDDGCGVESFQSLVELATSGWKDEKVQLSDRPFGMGLFSLFYACQQVTIRSRGKVLQITRDDVIQRRELEVHSDASPVVKGTTIIMDGLESALLQEVDYGIADKQTVFRIKLARELRDRAVGFDIPVHLNELTLDRPCARDNLKGEATRVGWISVAGIHTNGRLAEELRDNVGYFLQGLPIEKGLHNRFDTPTTVVHLASEHFVPVMPDRAALQDANQQLEKVKTVLQEIRARFLAEQKATLTGAEFVTKYFGHVIKAGLAAMLNDIPVIPVDQVLVVSSVNYSTDETWTSPHRPIGAMVARQDILDGHIKLWRYAPNNSIDSEFATAMLKVMERNQIGTIRSEDRFDAGHWIHQCTPDAREFVVEVIPGKELSRGDYVDACRMDSCEVRMVEDFSINITSRVDPNWRHTEVVKNDWVIVPDSPSEDQIEELYGDVIYYFTEQDASRSDPWFALSDFEDENDAYQEHWADSAAADWNATIAAIKGQPLDCTVAAALNKATEVPNHRQVDQVALVRVVKRWHNYDGTLSQQFDTVNPDAEFWANMAKELEQQPGTMAERLKAAFTAVARPGELVLDESAASHLIAAAGFRVLSGAIKNSWYVLLPGEREANFEAEDHNYMGLFSSKDEAEGEAYDAVVQKVEKVLGTTPDAFAALDLPAKWKQVKAAFAEATAK